MNFRKSIATLIFSIFACGMMFAEIPTGYYNVMNGKKGAELKTAAYNAIHNFVMNGSYDQIYSNLPSSFRRTDVRPESDLWWDMYSNIPISSRSFSGMNREHAFPKSWWGGLTDIPAYVDLNHLYPSEMAANTAKSNYPLGEVNRNQNIKFNNGLTAVGYPMAGQGGGAQFVFEPDDEYKGDFARTYFYMVTCYQNLTWKYFYMVSQNTYPTLTTWAKDLLLKWHRQDPVSDKEVQRNEAVYKIQNNRNPFIDFPELAEYIWGTKVDDVFDISNTTTPSGTPTLITPVQDMSLDFGQVAVGQTTSAKLWFKGENLTRNVTVSVYLSQLTNDNGPTEYFVPSVTSIPYTNINSADGYWLNVDYKPTEIGQHSATLLLPRQNGNGVPGSSIGIKMIGECLPVPTLTAPTATDATEVEASSYVANWTPVEGEVVDYYLINRTKYKNGNISYEQVLAEEPGTLIEDFNDSDSETYTVQSVRLGYKSPESNLITVANPAGVGSVENDAPWAIVNIPGGLRVMCGNAIETLYIYDTTGRVVKTLETVESYTDIYLPNGVYLVKSTGRPVKAIVR